MSSRQERRAQARGKSNAGGPKKRDPMTAIYIGFAIAIVAVLLIFTLFNLKQRHDYAAAYATPTPGPNATVSPIPLKDGVAIGKTVLKDGDVFGGGFGSPVDGIQCEAEMATFHVHTHLALFVNGKQIAVPRYTGFAPNGAGGGCLYWLHTHSQDGIIHVETPGVHDFTLGNFFHVWGASLSHTAIATFHGPVTAYVNGMKYDGDLAAIPLGAHQQITLEVGTPLVAPPNYSFPPGD